MLASFLIPWVSFIFHFHAPSHAFTLNNNVEAKFQGEFVPVNFSATSTCENTGRSVEKLRSLVDLSLKKFWNAVATSDLDIRPGSLVSKGGQFETDALCRDGVNSPCTPNSSLLVDDGIFITCNNNSSNFPNGSIAGATLAANIDGNKLKGAVIAINNHSNSLLSAVSDDTLTAIIAHEIGHAFGLGHSPHKENLMYYATVTKRDKLGQDDLDAITYLYPREDKILGLVGCDFIDLNSELPESMDQELKLYHVGIDGRDTHPELEGLNFNFVLSFLLGFFLVYLIFPAKKFALGASKV